MYKEREGNLLPPFTLKDALNVLSDISIGLGSFIGTLEVTESIGQFLNAPNGTKEKIFQAGVSVLVSATLLLSSRLRRPARNIH